MSNFRVWWLASQWFPVVTFVIFAISCVVTSFVTFGSQRDNSIIFFAGIAVGGFGAVFNLTLNIASNKVERLVLALPERRSLRTRKTIGWGAVALRATGLGVTVALGAMYASRKSAVFSTAMGFVTAGANGIAIVFSLYKLFVSDRRDEKRRDGVAESQQFGAWPANQQQQQQYMPLQQQQPYGLPPPQGYGQAPQQTYGWQPQYQQQASTVTSYAYYGGAPQQAYDGVQQPFQQPGQQQASFPPVQAYAAQAQGHGQY